MAVIQTFRGARRLVSPFRSALFTAAEINVLFTTPAQLMPGTAGRVLIPRFLLARKPAGTAFTLGMNTHLKVHWTDGSGTELGFVASAGFLDQTTEKSAAMLGPANTAAVLSSFAPAVWAAAIGAPLVLVASVGNPSGGSPVEFAIVYESYPGSLPR